MFKRILLFFVLLLVILESWSLCSYDSLLFRLFHFQTFPICMVPLRETELALTISCPTIGVFHHTLISVSSTLQSCLHGQKYKQVGLNRLSSINLEPSTSRPPNYLLRKQWRPLNVPIIPNLFENLPQQWTWKWIRRPRPISWTKDEISSILLNLLMDSMMEPAPLNANGRQSFSSWYCFWRCSWLLMHRRHGTHGSPSPSIAPARPSRFTKYI